MIGKISCKLCTGKERIRLLQNNVTGKWEPHPGGFFFIINVDYYSCQLWIAQFGKYSLLYVSPSSAVLFQEEKGDGGGRERGKTIYWC